MHASVLCSSTKHDKTEILGTNWLDVCFQFRHGQNEHSKVPFSVQSTKYLGKPVTWVFKNLVSLAHLLFICAELQVHLWMALDALCLDQPHVKSPPCYQRATAWNLRAHFFYEERSTALCFPLDIPDRSSTSANVLCL